VTAGEALTAFGGRQRLGRQTGELIVEPVEKVEVGIGYPLLKGYSRRVLGFLPAPVVGLIAVDRSLYLVPPSVPCDLPDVMYGALIAFLRLKRSGNLVVTFGDQVQSIRLDVVGGGEPGLHLIFSDTSLISDWVDDCSDIYT
jgi:hypothetical protein